MKIALIGASGFVGSAVLNEAVARGHEVTALARNPDKVETSAQVTAKKVDATDTKALAEAIGSAEVVISAFCGGHGDPDIYRKHLAGSDSIREAAKEAGKRLIVVGGAGSLYAPDGTQFVDSDQFPQEYKSESLAARDALKDLTKEPVLDWTLVSPAFVIKPGERTGKFRLGGENPVFDDKGESTISVGDLAVAIIDETEKAQHSRKRFTLGY